MKRQFRPFEVAREFSHLLKLKSQKEWRKYAKSDKRPKDIPANPSESYKNEGWQNWGDWLGTGTIASFNIQFKDFSVARDFVHSLNLKSSQEWRKYCNSDKKPKDIPVAPWKTYRNKGWKNLGDWLGTDTVAPQNRKFCSFTEARKFVHGLGFKSREDWNNYCKSNLKPNDIPSSPERPYKDEWKGWGDWLGSGTVANFNKQFRPFVEARQFIQKLGIKNDREWREYCKSGKKPDDIPATPWNTYKHQGWIDFGNWIGTETIAPQKKQFKSFEEARDFVHLLNLKDKTEWANYSKSNKKPNDIPANPARPYKDEWKGWGDWLGTERIANQTKAKHWRSFKEAREFVKSLGLKTHEEWREYCKSGKKPDDIPSYPWEVYSKIRKTSRYGKTI